MEKDSYRISKDLIIRVYGGYREVGGNLIKVTYKDESIILDLGLNLALKNQFYTWPAFEVEDPRELFDLKIASWVEGLYTEWKEPYTPATGFQSDILGAFISHAHLDHTYLIPQINREIPIYIGEATLNIYISRRKASRRRKFWVDDYIKFYPFRSFMSISIGSFRVIPIHVDHSIPGSYGFIIETPEGIISYSGDYRLHGTSEWYDGKGSLTMDFINRLAQDDIELFISEGTKFEDVSLEHERDVLEKVKYILSTSRGPVLSLFSETDIDRYKSFYTSVEELGWKILIPIRQFYILYELCKVDKQLKIDIDTDIVFPYIKYKSKYDQWEREIINLAEKEGYNIIKIPTDLVGNGLNKSVILGFTFIRKELMKIGLSEHTVSILSYSEPADEEGEVELDKLLNWLRNYSIPSYRVHCSGHIYMNDLRKIIEIVSPKDIYIIHSEYPDIIKKFLGY